ncbi:MAG: hypothetical protein IKU81_08805, partial [Oscillibacter sp.]|nr:hypothetical protein [Oscillibacter sp.]
MWWRGVSLATTSRVPSRRRTHPRMKSAAGGEAGVPRDEAAYFQCAYLRTRMRTQAGTRPRT